jgi:superoxide dismutase, Fe-Mn family
MKLELPPLPFKMNALEPYISEMSLECHHGMLHQAYVTNLNSLINGTRFSKLDLETIIKISDGPVFNNASQVWNHSFYFEGLLPGNHHSLDGSFSNVIKSNFGSVSFFKSLFTKAAVSLFGAGWIWLVFNAKGSLEIIQKSNAGNPLRVGLVPLLSCDMWEHAYYLDYKNRRHDYVEAFWKLVNWEIVEARYSEALLK